MKVTPYAVWWRRRRWDDQHGIVHGPAFQLGTERLLACGPATSLYLTRIPYQPVTCLQCIVEE